jgi:hypothetical protein
MPLVRPEQLTVVSCGFDLVACDAPLSGFVGCIEAVSHCSHALAHGEGLAL